jgi:predicted flap endonuclease-1-like 5' DNA nuclease
MTLIHYDMVPIIVAVLLGFIVGWWMFRNRRGASAKERQRIDSSAAGNAVSKRQAVQPTPDAAPAPAVESPTEPEAAAPAVPATSGPPDDLQTLKGVGPKLATLLAENGVTRFDQLAGLDDTQVAAIDATLGAFKGRLARDRIVEQAAYLARGDRAGFEANFGKLGGS